MASARGRTKPFCQLCVVDGLGSLGAYAFAHIVLRILSGMSGTSCSTVLL